METDELISRIDHLIGKGKNALENKIPGDSYTSPYVPHDHYIGFKASSLSFIRSLCSEAHPYYHLFSSTVTSSYLPDIQAGISILWSVKHEVENGWLASLKQLVTAEVFSDFLEMSKHLLDENYKDASAVMIGSVLEEHLRYLCNSHGVDTQYINKGDSIQKKASLLNADLRKAGAYGPLEEKQVTAWLGLRNSAAHGCYEDYQIPQVELMYQGVLDFITRVK